MVTMVTLVPVAAAGGGSGPRGRGSDGRPGELRRDPPAAGLRGRWGPRHLSENTPQTPQPLLGHTRNNTEPHDRQRTQLQSRNSVIVAEHGCKHQRAQNNVCTWCVL